MLFVITLLLVSIPIDAKLETSSSVDTLLVSIKNNTTDTLFLFDSYLDVNKPYMESPYLHRFNFFNKEFKLSFWPLVTLLSPDIPPFSFHRRTPEDVWKYGTIAYHFKKMPPNETLIICIPRKALEINEFVQDFEIKELLNAFLMGKDIPLNYNHYYKTDVRPKHDFILEFAIYKDVLWCNYDTLTLYYRNFLLFASDFSIISLPITI